MNAELTELTISAHAYDRMKERNGWNKKTADRMLSKVYCSGIRPEAVKGYLKHWVNHKAEISENGKEFVLYGERLYIFNGGMMLTVLSVPTRSSLIREAA